MRGAHTDRLAGMLRAVLWDALFPYRHAIMSAGALLFVLAAVLLVLDAMVPFPPPSERLLYDPTDWSLVFHPPAAPPARPDARGVSRQPVGGTSMEQAPITVLLYHARAGDTMSGIAARLGMDVDTISSMNRVDGRGVHNVSVGEVLKIPSENGITLAAASDFDAQCKHYGVSPEDVLAANGLARSQLATGMKLFFPGVQHTGYARSLAVGVGVALPIHGWETSPFGWRADPFTGVRSHHSGVDIAAPSGSPIHSATDGVVVAATYDSMLGNYVEVRAQLGYSYVYGHMSQILTHVGARVAAGTVLGLVGQTGYATGPHLHFEVRLYGVPQNPRNYLPGIR
jgi:murein DD-endopeptidase MepM/ murein hydrolase activator NlpD